MNKIFKSALVALVAVMGLTLASCVNEYEYDAATSEGSKVYFSKDLAATVDVSFEANSFQVAVNRTSTDGELSVPVTVTMSEESIFTPAASNVTFANGEATAYLTFTYDPAKVEYGKYDDIAVTISDATQVTTYGLSTYAFKAGKTEWKLMEENNGMGTYRDDLMTTFGAEPQIINVKIYESVVTAGKYRIEAPYDPEGDFGKNKMWSSEEEAKEEYNPTGEISVDLVIDASDPKFVWFPEFDSGYNYEGDAISFLSYIQFYMDNGYDMDFLKSKVPQYFGKMEDNVITMPVKSVLFAFSREPWNFTNDNGLFAIALPGATIGDFSLETSYKGIFTDAASKVYAVTEVKLGDDATNVKAVVMPADADASAVADAIAAGELEGVDIIDGANNVPIPEDLSGKLQVIIVVLNGKSVKTVESVPFEYYRGDVNPWKSIGVGLYTDDVLWPNFTEDGKSTTYKVEIEEHSETPGLYRIKNAYSIFAEEWKLGSGDGATDIEIHAEDPNGVYILNQSIGLSLDYDGYGEMSFETRGGYLIAEGYTVDQLKNYGLLGTLKDGVITFPVFKETDDDNNVITDDAGNPYYYQGWLNFEGGKYWSAGINGEMQLVLPNANASAIAKAKRAAAASDFERRLYVSPSRNMAKKDSIRIKKKVEKSNLLRRL